MKGHNIYKIIVIILVFIILLQRTWQKTIEIKEEQNIYKCMITSPSILTEETIEELKKLEGFQDFYPMMSLQVTLKLEAYSMDVTLKGVDIESYPIKLSSKKETLFLGSMPLLFISPDCLEGFTDSNGHGPGKKKIAQWKQEYQQLSIGLENEIKKEKAEIAGILKEPRSCILMEQSQLKGLAEKWGKPAQMNQGYLCIKGKTNAEQMAEILQALGYIVEK